MNEGEIALRDGRTVGYADFGPEDGTAVLWCHGGPGSRLDAMTVAKDAADAGFRVIGIDRPGYGKSTPQPGRVIAGWVADGLTVADHLRIERFAVVGVSTGGAYALALASLVPARVIGVVACCALTDMRWAEGRAMMKGPAAEGIWNAGDRVSALKLATDVMGADGSKMLIPSAGGPQLSANDLATLSDPTWMAALAAGMPAMFAHGVAGYTDDRRADGPGWGTFDTSQITCPVAVLHGGSDSIVPVGQAHHTAAIVPGATLRVFAELGHFSIIAKVIPELTALVRH